MKKIHVAILFITLITNAIAQNKSKINIAVSLTPIGYSNMIQKSDAGDKINNKAKPTYGIGVDVNLPIKNDAKLLLRPGIVSMGYWGSQNISKARVQYLIVPVVFEFLIKAGGFKLYHGGKLVGTGKDKKIVGGIGAYAGSAISGTYQLSGGAKTKYKFGESATDNRSLIDYGYVLQFGVINPEKNFKSIIQARIGTNNLIPDARIVGKSLLKTTTICWSISIPISKK